MVFTTSSSSCLPNPHIHNLLLQSRQIPLPLPQQLASHLLQTQCSLLPSTNKTCKGKLFGMSTGDTAHSPKMPHANRLKNGSSAKHISQMCFSTKKTGGKKNTNLMLHIWVGYYWRVFSYLPAKDLCQMTALHLGWLQHLPAACWTPSRPPAPSLPALPAASRPDSFCSRVQQCVLTDVAVAVATGSPRL